MPIMTSFEPWALALFVGAVIAVFGFKIGTVKTLMISSAMGGVLYALGVTA
jgi:hypothetical protein